MDQKRTNKMFLYANDTIYLENLKESIIKVLELINEFSKVIVYQINKFIHISVY